MVCDPAYRLITVTGPGGVGKTRLALHVAASALDDFNGEVIFVSLASIREPHLVLLAIGQAGGHFSDLHDGYEEQLIQQLQGVPMLLVLDNLEQVLDVAPALGRLLASCPDLTILATSQAPLGLNGEQLYPLAPLSTPPVDQRTKDDILQADAVALFVQRAHAVNPHLEINDRNAATIAAICRKLDGLPLAIELAAARTNILSPEALLARLSNRLQVLGGERRDVPDRLRTMRHAIAWSYELLSEHEQELFRWLVVFAGGFSLDAVEAVFVPKEDGREAYDALATLVDRSLVHSRPRASGEARFLVLETLRDFGLEQLELRGETREAHLAHARYTIHLAERAEPHLVGNEQTTWLDRLDAESENIRAAVEWSLANGEEEFVLRICGAIWRFLATRGLITEGRRWLELALAAQGTEESAWRTKALIGAGNLAEDLRDLAVAEAHFGQARDLAGETGNLVDESRALIGLGTVAHDRGDYAIAYEMHKQATGIAREAGDPRGIAMGLGNMAAVSYFQGRLDDALEFWEESQSILSQLGDTISESLGASNIGVVAMEKGDYERAERYLVRSLDLQRQLNTQRDLPLTLINLGEIARVRGDYTLAHDALAEATTLLRQYGNTVLEGYAVNGLAKLMLTEGDISGAAALIVESMRLVAGSDDQNIIIENADVLTHICSAHGNHAAVAQLMGSVTRLQEELSAARGPVKQEEIIRVETAARKALGEQEYARHEAAGRELDADALRRRIVIVAREIVGPTHAFPSPVGEPGSPPPATPEVEHSLTTREIEILQLLAQGRSTKEISDTLFISPRTTATHIANILGKLEVPSRTAAVAFAMRNGLV
jgi:predicted ATPase/DNA-binding CsgD family transcriptional regulator